MVPLRHVCAIVLNLTGCDEELKRVTESKKLRAGRGKTRNRRYVMRKGPLVVYAEDNGIVRAFANVPGIDTCHVDRLNILQLAPGGAVGRFIIWTRTAFARLMDLYGDSAKVSAMKSNYMLHRPLMTNPDLARIINSNEVQSQLNMPKENTRCAIRNRNPLRNHAARCRLNPAHKALKLKRRNALTPGTKVRKLIEKRQEANRAAAKENRKKVAPSVKAIAQLGSEIA